MNSLGQTIVDEACIACGHPAGKHFEDVIGKVRCLHVRGSNSRMTGEYSTSECSCVDYVVTDSYQAEQIAKQSPGRA